LAILLVLDDLKQRFRLDPNLAAAPLASQFATRDHQVDLLGTDPGFLGSIGYAQQPILSGGDMGEHQGRRSLRIVNRFSYLANRSSISSMSLCFVGRQSTKLEISMPTDLDTSPSQLSKITI
jgi:hypothetical protein